MNNIIYYVTYVYGIGMCEYCYDNSIIQSQR